MKYLFINSVAGFGSTGRIVLEQCRELQAQGHECLVAYGRRAEKCGDVPTLAIGTAVDYCLHAARHRVLGDGGFGSWAATRRFLRRVEAYDPDVVWLHNLHGYYIHLGLLFQYLKKSEKKVIWTLHDCWAFTGNCPHFWYIGCEKWRTCCNHCLQLNQYPQTLRDSSEKNFEKKQALFTGMKDMTIQVPSEWMAQLVGQSFLKEYPLQVVPNQVDTRVFRPTPSDLRRQWGVEGKFLVLGVSNVWTERKGLQTFCQLAKLLPDSCQVVLIGLTKEQRKALPPEIIGLPRTSSLTELAQAYTAADVYVSASVEESFGMTVLEAACCGTVPIVYAGTASQEIALSHGGECVQPGAESLAQAILRRKQLQEAQK